MATLAHHQFRKVTINAVQNFHDLRQFEMTMLGYLRESLRELVLVLPDPFYDMNRCNYVIRRLFEILSTWGPHNHGDHAWRPYIDLEIFLEDNSGGRGNFYVTMEAARPFAAVPDARSLRPGPHPFAKVHVVKSVLFGRGRRLLMVDAWRAQMCPYLADGLLGVNRHTFLVGDLTVCN
ncbi:uncharacterized protein PG998_007084 [Apiospora kogelbergensis]|uniref:uncharacterized protein n=1 Tax=Apiospora kogelbergensis TaxID=1337665 RepID=UPI003130DC24